MSVMDGKGFSGAMVPFITLWTLAWVTITLVTWAFFPALYNDEPRTLVRVLADQWSFLVDLAHRIY